MGEQSNVTNGEPRCCIAGCGPAGAVLGLLLARAGVDVLVLEKHGDFLRDFRGDTIHPSTLDLLDDLGLVERFLQLPHTEVSLMRFRLPDGSPLAIDLRRLRGRHPFVAFVPQWDFLDFITREAARYPGFHLRMNAEVLGLIEEDGAIRGVRYRDAAGEHQARAALTVGADGRTSVTRAAARLPSVATSPLMDVWWFRLSRRPDDPPDVALRLASGHVVGLFNRGEYWQIAYIIPKGADEQARAAGIAAFRETLAALVPELADRVGELESWDQVKLLSVRSDRLVWWYRPGYLAIGDAAHAMSPIGGIGINLAIQDAVEAANVLWEPLRAGAVPTSLLATIQRRRALSVRIIQGLQTLVQDQVVKPALASPQAFRIPRGMRVVLGLPVLRDLPARVLAYGVGRPRVRVPKLAEVAPSGGDT
jgi:2-polyprenyl-6-methoxyphenol hydroxylase-like FAD-dependent oxidoreductase